MGTPPEWTALDPRHLWHPYAPAPDPLPAHPVVGSEGVHLILADGRRLVDGMASWWCAIHGYRHPDMVRALQEQVEVLPHVMFGGLTHEPAARLAERLARLSPGDLNRVFFCDSGSVSVEVALKLAVQYWQACEYPEKCCFLALRGGYHGDTFAAMSVSDPDNSLHDRFRNLLPRQYFTPQPPDADCTASELEDACARFEADLVAHQYELAGVVLEPVLQGAGGFHPYPPAFLAQAAALCARHQVLLIADEIATGFGRTGTLFACEQADIVPDILCLGKALTGGMLSLAATLTREEIAKVVSEAGPFLHGPTFMANPAACRVALASLDLLESRDWKTEVAAIETILRRELLPLQSAEGIARVRVLGAFAVVGTSEPVDASAWQALAIQRGVWLRPFQNFVYLMPPFIIQESELMQLTSAIRAGVSDLL